MPCSKCKQRPRRGTSSWCGECHAEYARARRAARRAGQLAYVVPTHKTCPRCATEKPITEFGLDRNAPDGRQSRCKDCGAASNEEWRARNPDWRVEYGKLSRAHERELLLDAYGRLCACCGESTPEFLTLDHVGGVVPPEHRDARGRRKASTVVYRLVREEGYPAAYRLLCFNCNHAVALYGACPHQRHLEAVV